MELSEFEAPGRVLCSRCRELDVSNLWPVEAEIPYVGKPIFSLGKRPHTVECDLCQFFIRQSPKYAGNYRLHLRFFDEFQTYFSGDFQDATEIRPFLSVLREDQSQKYDFTVAAEVSEPGITIYVSNKNGNPSTVRLIDAQSIDYAMVRSWISKCQKNHRLCGSKKKSRNTLPYIYLLDCFEGEVTRRDPSERYLALSYVWGPPTSQPSTQATAQAAWPKNAFSINDAPLTVQDAVQVAKEIGIKYLWIDRYCINQNADEEKKMMLQSMDLIYQNAEATIVAMYGNNDRAGLPGVSVPRDPQPLFKTASGYLVSTCPPVSTVLAESVWATRGWTYQEVRLSRRCLFFTRYQLYFVCRMMSCSEAVPQTDERTREYSLVNHRTLDNVLFEQDVDNEDSDSLFPDRLQFSQRSLTYESDILNAFRGILSHSRFVTFWGVTINPRKAKLNAHTGFALGLLWRAEGWSRSVHLKAAVKEAPRARRPGFPTWSWTSVTGAISHEWAPYQSSFAAYLAARPNASRQNDARVFFSLKLAGEWVPLDQVMQQQHNSNMLPEESPLLLVEGDVIRVQFTKPENKKRNKVAPYRIYGCDDSDPGFWASLEFGLNQDGGDREPDNIAEDALILISWDDECKKTKRRVMLMLLRWVGDNVAERRGLLTGSRGEYDAEMVRKIPKTRKTFTLR